MVWVGPEENRLYLAWQLPKRSPFVFLRQCRVNFRQEERLLTLRMGRAPPFAKKTHQNLEAQCPQLSVVIPHSPFPTRWIPLFSVNDFTLTSDHQQGWGFNLCCNSAISRLRFCTQFSAISALWL